jgi:hypothetical protein
VLGCLLRHAHPDNLVKQLAVQLRFLFPRGVGGRGDRGFPCLELTVTATETLQVYGEVRGDLKLNLQLLRDPVIVHLPGQGNHQDFRVLVKSLTFDAGCLLLTGPAEEVIDVLVSEKLLQTCLEFNRGTLLHLG